LVSPPETLQVTEAAPPELSVAVNCSAAAPLAALALQPVQLVSKLAVPGAMAKTPVEGLALTPPEPQPASTKTMGAAKAARRASGDAALPRLPFD
jgi:hypothetical protein